MRGGVPRAGGVAVLESTGAVVGSGAEYVEVAEVLLERGAPGD